jgi:hypothetical protein
VTGQGGRTVEETPDGRRFVRQPNGLRQYLDTAQRGQQRRNQALFERRVSGLRTTVRRTPIKPVSDKRRVENRERRRNLTATFGTDPLCVYPDCARFADDAHEVLSRARGGSITDPANIRPLCREHHNYVTTHPAEAAALGLSISAFGGTA